MLSTSHFRDVLSQETMTIAALCDEWQTFMNTTPGIPDDASGKIQVAVGQGRLLMKKKFEQFRGLIDASEGNNSGKPVMVEDLQGFWELVKIQVSDIHNKFQELAEMKENGWQQISSLEYQRQPLGNLNRTSMSSQGHKSLDVKRDFTAEAKERLAQAKALAKKRMKDQLH